MVKSFTLDAKQHRISPRVPQHMIERFVARMHVGTPDTEVTSTLRKAIERNGGGEWTETETRQAEKFALFCHRKNQRLVERFRF